MKHLNPNHTPIPPLQEECSPCTIDYSSLGLLQLPLIAKLNRCSKLIAPIPYKLSLMGPDNSQIDVESLSKPILELEARTPVTSPLKDSTWTPPRINVDNIKKFLENMGLLKKSSGEHYVNVLPQVIVAHGLNGILKLREGGHQVIIKPRSRREGENNLENIVLEETKHGLKIIDEHTGLVTFLDGINIAKIFYEEFVDDQRLLIKTDQGVNVVVLRDKVILDNVEKPLRMEVYHNVLNPKLIFLQPLGLVEDVLVDTRIRSSIICTEAVSKTVCMVSASPIEVLLLPGKLVVKVSNDLVLQHGTSSHSRFRVLDILWYMVNKPFKLVGVELRAPYLRITPNDVKLLQLDYSEDINKLTLYLLNTANKVLPVEIWLPVKILSAKIVNIGTNSQDTVEIDYNSIIVPMHGLSMYKLELRVHKLPPLFMKELERRPIISPYTPL